MRKIRAGGSHSKKFILVDNEDYDRLKNYGWCISFKNNRVICVQAHINYKTVLIHRFILNPPKHFTVDHINGNPLDNRKSNLRLCSQRQNVFNARKLRPNKTSKYKGVYWFKDKNKWCVNIGIYGKTYYCGLFKVQKDAAHIYDQYALQLFGDYASTNFSY